MTSSNKEYKDYIKKHIQLSEVCNRLGIRIHKQGGGTKVLCPFHDDTNPSLEIYSDHYYCYSCHASGDLFSLIAKEKNVDFSEALSWVENEFPFVLHQKPIQYNKNRPSALPPMELAKAYYEKAKGDILNETAKKRGYSADFLRLADLCETRGNVLCKNASPEELEKLVEQGLIVHRRSGSTLFRDYFYTKRLLFPLRDLSHRIVGFAGRSIDEGDLPKYRYTKGMQKSRQLYRLEAVMARRTHSETNGEVCPLYLTEGFFDALRLESIGLDAVAVMGSHLSDQQLRLLDFFVSNQMERGRTVELNCFLDSDRAGIEGACEMLKSLWRNDKLRRTPLNILVNTQNFIDPKICEKDPDEILKGKTLVQAEKWLQDHRIHPMEFLLRYFLEPKTLGYSLENCTLEKQWEHLDFARRVHLINQIANLFSLDIWKNLLDFYQDSEVSDASRFVLRLFNSYLLGKSDDSQKQQSNAQSIEQPLLYPLAIEMARTGYQQEFMPIDTASWNRLHAGIDLIERYDNELLKAHKDNRQLLQSGAPLLGFYTPKDAETDRLKALPDHETLLLQHYVLNELLREGVYAGYARNIPAVRYDPTAGIYTTGTDTSDAFENCSYQAVSFAYEVDMQVLRGEKPPVNGLFRHFYDCWKDFISFLQEGIALLNREKIFRAKLDIRRFYENIRKRTIRDALAGPFEKAFGYMDNQFCAMNLPEDSQTRTDAVVDLLLEGLFNWTYVDTQSGKSTRVKDPLVGIPQGPALSAYAANVLLFQLDQAVLQYVNEVNAQCEEGRIQVRYARYVDDMVILAANGAILTNVERIIQEQLYKLGLELSPKTDRPDAVNSEEAYEWLVDQKGGLGISASSLTPDDPLEEIWGTGYAPYSVNRRDALSILRGAGDILDRARPGEFEEAFLACFKTEEIRYRDVMRLAAFALEHLILAENITSIHLYDVFIEVWKDGQEKMDGLRSILSREDIAPMAFLDGLLSLLEKPIPLTLSRQEQESRLRVQKTAVEVVYAWESIKKALNDYSVKPSARNTGFLQLRAIQLGYDAFSLPTTTDEQKNHIFRNCWELTEARPENDGLWYYLKCWRYAFAEASLKLLPNGCSLSLKDFPADLHDEPLVFHFLTVCLELCKNEEDFRELGSFFLSRTQREAAVPGSVIRRIEQIWFLREGESNSELAKLPKIDGDEGLAALKSLSNFLHQNILPAVIAQNPLMRHALFTQSAKEPQLLYYLPVPPGVDYPAIFAVNDDRTTAYWADFSSESQSDTRDSVTDLEWNVIPLENESRWNLYQAQLPDAPWEFLESPLDSSEEHWKPETVEKIAELFEELCALFESPTAGYLLSKRHLFRDSNGKVQALSYYDSHADRPSGVAVSGSGMFLKWTVLSAECGKKARAAALLLEDLLELNIYPLETETADICEILSYGLQRLTGQRMLDYLPFLSENSFQQTVTRTLGIFRSYAKAELWETQIFLLETALTDRLIEGRLKRESYAIAPEEVPHFLNNWMFEAVRREFPHLERVLVQAPTASELPIPLRRVTDACRTIGVRLLKIGGNECKSIRTLGAAALMAAVNCDIRARVLEWTWSLHEEDISYLKIGPIRWTNLNLLPDTVLLNSGEVLEVQQRELQRMLLEYRRGENDRKIEKTTSAGWLFLLGWLLESDFQGKLYSGHSRLEKHKSEIISTWESLQALFFIADASDECEFPYEGFAALTEIWTIDTVDQVLKALHQIDQSLNFEIHRKASKYFSLTRGERLQTGITLRLDSPNEESRPAPFAFFFQHSNRWPQYEENKQERIWTQTMLGKRVLGVSAISCKIAGLMQGTGESGAYTSNQLSDKSIEDSAAKDSEEKKARQTGNPSNPDIQETLTDKGEPPAPKSEVDAEITEPSPEAEQAPVIESSRTVPETDSSSGEIKEFREKLESLQKEQRSNWEHRRSANINTDRIALFQFDVDDSYTHPLGECCCLHQKEIKEIKMKSVGIKDFKQAPTKWNSEYAAKYQQTLYSCAEYRRRQLLKSAFEACEAFGVEILLLPEYSIRPETASWILEEMQRETNYTFSVWAGTCRLTPGRNYPSGPWHDFQDQLHDCKAILPIICNKPALKFQENKGEYPKLLLTRSKKYPSISMEELINPSAQPLYPVMKQQDCLFGDARDDVMELICAEVFLATNPGNMTAFGQVFDRLYTRFRGGAPSEDRQLDCVMDDIHLIGSHTSLVQLNRDFSKYGNGKYGRTPILLVPAYTTRTVDYYITGQAGYLATGLTTVFCNAAGSPSRGQSCFVGTDCWEKDGAQKEAYMPDYSVYHGALPGIYHQYDTRKGHGSLGQKEQALLICDVNPAAVVGKPRPESLFHPLTLVAHLPVIESCKYTSRMKTANGNDCGFYERCRCDRAKKRSCDDIVVQSLEKLAKHIAQLKSAKTSAHDKNPDEVYNALLKIGIELDSSGLKERAVKYLQFHRCNPQSISPPTMLDWIWVDIDFPHPPFASDCNLDVPAFLEKSLDNLDNSESDK